MSVERLRFKDENGNNYPDWNNFYLGNISKISTGRLDANAMKPFGEYKFFTCAKEVFRINDYAFDTEALLISGNGANVGYIHYYKGKFNAYQRTYILDQFKLNVFFLRYLLEVKLKNRIAVERRDGNTPYITMSTLTKMKIQVPYNNKEQEKIGNFLSLFDRLIEKLETKMGLLKELKKGYLQQMFPTKGEKVPKIRFYGFEYDWELYKLKEIAKFKQGTQVDSGLQFSVNSENRERFIRIIDYTQSSAELRYVQKKIVSQRVDKEDIVMVRYGASAGFVGRGIAGIIANNMFTINPNGKIDKTFLYIYLKMEKTYKKLNSSNGSSAMPAINFSMVGAIYISIPKKREQEKIVNFFKYLNSMIKEQEKELNVIEKSKKGYMQRLFA